VPVTHKSSVWNDAHTITGLLGKLDLLPDAPGYLKNDGLGNLTWAIVAGGTSPALFTSSTSGIVPASGGGTVNYLRADGTWTTVSASAAWGSITGTLSSQTDLNTALNGKQATLGGTGFVKSTAGVISYDTSTYYLASNPSGYTSNLGTVTSVAALTLGTTGTDLSSTVATGTTTPVITLQVPTASGSNRGALASGDWTTFNNKQAAFANLSTIGGLANASGWLNNNGSGTFSYSTPTAANVGAIATTVMTTLGDILYGGASGVATRLGGVAGVLTSTGAAAPSFSTTPTLTGTNFTGVPTSGLTGALAAAQFPALTGDVTTVAGALATTLVTTQPSVHTWTLVQTFSATDVHTLGATFTASASVSTAGYVGYNSTQLAHEFFADGLKHQLTGTIFTQTATGTNGAATAITDIMGTGVGTRVLPTSWTLTGKTIRVRCAGTVTTAATPGTTVITLRLNAGTPVTIVASPSLTLTASMTSMPFEIEFLLTCRSTTSIMGTGKFLVSSSTTGITGLSVLIGTVTAATVVAATSYTVQICATDGTASGTVYTTQTASVEVLN